MHTYRCTHTDADLWFVTKGSIKNKLGFTYAKTYGMRLSYHLHRWGFFLSLSSGTPVICAYRCTIEVIWNISGRYTLGEKITAKCRRNKIYRLNWRQNFVVAICPKKSNYLGFSFDCTQEAMCCITSCWRDLSPDVYRRVDHLPIVERQSPIAASNTWLNQVNWRWLIKYHARLVSLKAVQQLLIGYTYWS